MADPLHEYLGFFEAAKPTAPSQSGLVKISVAEAQSILHKLGWPKTKGSTDGLYGPGTRGAWEKYALQIKANPAFDRAGPREAWVNPTTKARLMVGGMPAPAAEEDPLLKKISEAAPYKAPESAQRAPTFTVLPEEQPTATVRKTNRPVLELQKILKALGWTKLKLDGLYGPNTRRAWESSAKKRSLDPLFKKVSGKTVTVNMATWMKLKAQAGMAAQRYVPPSQKAAPAPAPPAPAPGTVVKPVAELQKLLLAIGFRKRKALTDGLYGPTTKKAWGIAASNRKLPGTFERVDGKTARVAEATYKKIATDAAGKKKAPAPAAPAPAPDTVVRDVAELQALLLAVGFERTPALTDGLYGPKTRAAWRQAARARKVPKTFTRVTGKTVRVDKKTYQKIKADAVAEQKAPAPVPTPAPAPASPAPAPPAPAPGTVVKPVAELQKLLLAIGFRKRKALTDGLYGPTTKKAWGIAASNRKLPGTFERVDGKTARVNLETYTRVKTDAAKRREKPPTPKQEPVPSMVKISVKTLQAGLNGRGARPLLDVDGVWGSRTERAFKQWLAKQPGGKESRYQVSSNRREITLPRAYALSLQEAAKAAPEVPPRVDIPVETVKKGLSVGGMSVGRGTQLDATTKRSLDSFIEKLDGGNTGYKVSKDGSTIKRIRRNVANKLRELAGQYQEPGKPAPPPPPPAKPEPPPPEPAPDPVQQAAQQIAAGATASVPVSLVQKAILAVDRYRPCLKQQISKLPSGAPCIRVTGTWNENTAKALIDILLIEKRFHPYWFAAFPMLLSNDRRSIRLFPQQVEALKKLQKIYGQLVSPPPSPEPEAQLPPPPEIPVPEPPPLPAPAPEPAPVPAPEPAPSPSPGRPAAGPYIPPQAATAWTNLVGALRSIETYGPKITAAIEEAANTTGLRDEVAQKYQAWVDSVNGILARAAQLIEQSPELQQVIDKVGTQMGIGLQGLSGLEAYFADVSSTTSRILNVLREPFPSVLSGLELGQAATLAARAGAVASRFGGALWRGLMQLLGSRTVAVVGATQVGVAGLSDVINGEVRSYNDYNRWILSKVASGELSPAAGEAAMRTPPERESVVMPLVVGGVILGGLALFLSQRD